MYVRLHLLSPLHLEPEILIVDEVLRRRGLGFPGEVIGKWAKSRVGGRTILFVSHNLSSLITMCGQGIVLESGNLVHAGPVREAVACYVARENRAKPNISAPIAGDEYFRLRSARLVN